MSLQQLRMVRAAVGPACQVATSMGAQGKQLQAMGAHAVVSRALGPG